MAQSCRVTRGASLLVAVLAAAGAAACGGESAVTRIVDGHAIDGHFIEPDAYAEYLDGVVLEARGDLKGAEAAYERALDADGAAEIWARLGKVRCRTARRASDDAFERAKWKGGNIAPVWVADAECALERGEIARAKSSAVRAASLEPKNAQASLLVVRALVSARDDEAAARWLRATRLLYPEAAGLPSSLAEVVGDGVPSAVSPPAVSRLDASWSGPADESAIAAVDGALAAGDAAQAKAAAVRARLSNAALALRAVELGQIGLSKELSELTLAAEPGNVDARIAALAAADLSHDETALRKWATPLPELRDPPSAAAIRVMTALLYRRIGPGAARAFGEGMGRASSSAASPRAER